MRSVVLCALLALSATVAGCASSATTATPPVDDKAELGDDQFLKELANKPVMTDEDRLRYQRILNETISHSNYATNRVIALLDIGDRLRENKATEREGRVALERLTKYLASNLIKPSKGLVNAWSKISASEPEASVVDGKEILPDPREKK